MQNSNFKIIHSLSNCVEFGIWNLSEHSLDRRCKTLGQARLQTRSEEKILADPLWLTERGKKYPSQKYPCNKSRRRKESLICRQKNADKEGILFFIPWIYLSISPCQWDNTSRVEREDQKYAVAACKKKKFTLYRMIPVTRKVKKNFIFGLVNLIYT